MRVVLDPNVIISAALSPGGSPGRVFHHWLEGVYDLVVSALLLDELRRALRYPKLSDRIPINDAVELVELIQRAAVLGVDPDSSPSISSADPDDDYLIALADSARALLVSGDRDILDLSDELPVYSPFEFLALIESSA